MNKELKFKVGDGIFVTTGPMKDIYGLVIFYDDKTSRYLIRFGEQQQLYFTEDEIRIWDVAQALKIQK